MMQVIEVNANHLPTAVAHVPQGKDELVAMESEIRVTQRGLKLCAVIVGCTAQMNEDKPAGGRKG